MEIIQLLVSCMMLVFLGVIANELRKANREPRKAVIVPSPLNAWPNKKPAERQAEMGRETLGRKLVVPKRLTPSEFSEVAEAARIKEWREEQKQKHHAS